MKGLLAVSRGIGKVLLAVAVGVLFPVLIWVGLALAVNRMFKERKSQRASAPELETGTTS